MPKYAPLTNKQRDYICRCQNSWLNVAEGGKRAGKNIINLLAWAAVLEDHPEKLHLAGGVSASAVKMNIIDSNGFGLSWIFKGRCRTGQYDGRDSLIVKTRTGEKVIIIAGGDNSRSASLIKGHSYGTAYVTEANECHDTFIKEVFDRTLASAKRQLFFDLNPKPPSHWFYADILDYQDMLKRRGENPGYNYEHFTIADNLSISDASLRDELRKYDRSSIWYQRDIQGLRTSASGRIYTSYTYDAVKITPEEISALEFTELTVGIDVGGTDATVATLTGITRAAKPTVVHIDGMYHKQGIDNRMDETTYIHMITNWLMPWLLVYPHKIGTIYVDSANKLFAQGLKNELYRCGLNRFTVRSFDKADGINARIQLTCMLLAQGRYRVCTRLAKWHEALQMATWTQEGYEKGEWERTDNGSYPVDCLDSSEYSYYAMKRYLI